MTDCNDCGLDTDPDDAAPSCGAHVLCVSCWTTGDFRCRECMALWTEEKVADATDWFAHIRALPPLPFPAYAEPTPPEPLDLTDAPGTFAISTSSTPRDCAHCGRGIHVGRQSLGHRPVVTSHVHHYYHPECVIVP